ncbi:MAG: response regulator [Actinomycetota bacterium]|nr:response regulator transcription factor [Actinomycetota bacterium]
MTSVLVVDDEPQIRRALRTGLQARGYDVSEAPDGEDALAIIAAKAPDLVVLDLGLPDLDGAEVIRRLRTWSRVPVIILSVRDAQDDKVGALESGADDYITKPFDMEELVARMRATLRRTQPADAGTPRLVFDDLDVDLTRKLVQRAGHRIHLTPTEYALLEAMATNPGKLLTHRWLLQKVWGTGYGQETHYLHVYVRQLRQKLGDDTGIPTLIITEPGVGYRWGATGSPID